MIYEYYYSNVFNVSLNFYNKFILKYYLAQVLTIS